MYGNGKGLEHILDNDDSGLGCVVILLLAVFAIPIVGLYMYLREMKNKKHWELF